MVDSSIDQPRVLSEIAAAGQHPDRGEGESHRGKRDAALCTWKAAVLMLGMDATPETWDITTDKAVYPIGNAQRRRRTERILPRGVATAPRLTTTSTDAGPISPVLVTARHLCIDFHP